MLFSDEHFLLLYMLFVTTVIRFEEQSSSQPISRSAWEDSWRPPQRCPQAPLRIRMSADRSRARQKADLRVTEPRRAIHSIRPRSPGMRATRYLGARGREFGLLLRPAPCARRSHGLSDLRCKP